MTRKVEEAWPVRVLSKTGKGGMVMFCWNFALEPLSHIPHSQSYVRHGVANFIAEYNSRPISEN